MRNEISIRRLGLSGLLALMLAACGGGGGDTSATQTPSPVVPPTAIPGDPAFSSSCGNAPRRKSIGPFQTQSGDCFVAYQITAQELAEFRADYTHPPVRTRLLDAVKANFVERIDFIVVVLDLSDEERGSLPYGVNYTIQGCSVHNTACPRFGRLGSQWLTARTYLTMGPSLHELLHGYQSHMAVDSTTNYIIPTTVSSHWGFSSAGGQHGGWSRETLVSLGGGAYEAHGPRRSDASTWQAGFTTNANGGNAVPYSNLELWTMGLIGDTELEPVDVAENPASTGTGTFTASAIRTYTPAQIVARVSPEARPSTNTPRAFRALVVMASTSATLPAATVNNLNSDIEQFSMRSQPTLGYNFWTGTGMRATVHMATASELGAR
jgi:hypothetical protein